jgi:aspartate aminotransferase
MVRLASRVTGTSKKNFGMYEKAARLEASSGDLIHLELGMPCHDTPQVIKDAAIAAIQDGKVHYSHIKGAPELRNALASKLKVENGIEADPERIIVTNGLTQASFATFMALLDPGDEVILLEPYYPQHVGKIELAGAKVVLAPLDAENGFRIDPSLIEPRITSKTRMIVLVNPSNPTGRVYSLEELEALAALALKYDLTMVSDEVYEKIVFGDARHVSIASLPGMADRTVTLFAFTKAYAMDGWRLGFLVSSTEIVDAIAKIHANEVTHVNTFIQDGALAAITTAQSSMEEMVADDRAKRDMVVSRLNQMPGVTCRPPEGTIYAFPDISATGLKSQEAADRILEEAKVVVEAGSFYGAKGDGHLRICFGSQPFGRLEEAMDRLARFFNSI